MLDNYQIAAILHGDDQVVDSCFHADGRMFVSATRDSIQLIDSLSGECRKKIFTKTHGNANVVFTHHDQCILASSSKGSKDIRYLSLFDNRYLRFFKGHQTQVTSLAMSPVDDYFLSSSSGSDRTVCLWSLANPTPVARLALPDGSEDPKVAYTHDGLLFGVMVTLNAPSRRASNCIRLFDARNYDKGPFLQLKPTTLQLEKALTAAHPSMDAAQVQRCVSSSCWESFCFSPDGTRALVSTSSGMLISLDAYSDDGDPVVLFTEERSSRDSSSALLPTPSLGYCFTPDSKQVLAGTDDKKVRVYDVQTGRPLGVLGGGSGGEPPTPHVSAVSSVRCNPKYEEIATSGINTMLWLKTSLFTEKL